VNEPTVSVLIPAYNYGAYLDECLDSVFAQEDAPPFEVIVVDDASTDDTANRLARRADARLQVITHERNQGHARTINEALRLARGRYISRIDPDDRYRPRFMTLTVGALDTDASVGLAYGDVAQVDASGAVTATHSDVHHGGREYGGNELVALLADNFICSAAVMARREAWLAVPPVPEWLAFHDWYFTVMMARRWRFHYLPEVVAEYRVHAANLHTQIVRDRSEEASLFWLLDQVYAAPEDNGTLEAAKRRAHDAVYGRQSVALGDKYFGNGMMGDARRMYLRALRHEPRRALDATFARHLAATLVGARQYARLKQVIRARV